VCGLSIASRLVRSLDVRRIRVRPRYLVRPHRRLPLRPMLAAGDCRCARRRGPGLWAAPVEVGTRRATRPVDQRDPSSVMRSCRVGCRWDDDVWRSVSRAHAARHRANPSVAIGSEVDLRPGLGGRRSSTIAARARPALRQPVQLAERVGHADASRSRLGSPASRRSSPPDLRRTAGVRRRDQ